MRIGMIEKIVPHIAHFIRCRTSGCLLLKNLQSNTLAPMEMPATKCTVRIWLRIGSSLYDAVKFTIATPTDSGVTCGASESTVKPSEKRAAGTYSATVFQR